MAFTYNPSVLETQTGEVPEIRILPEAAGQSYKAGELVYLVSGAVTVCATDPDEILGIAQEDASGTTSEDAPVEMIRSSYVYKIRCTTAGTDYACSNFNEATAYSIIVSSNVHSADNADDSTHVVIFLGDINDEAGSADYWGMFRFIPAVLQFEIGI